MVNGQWSMVNGWWRMFVAKTMNTDPETLNSEPGTRLKIIPVNFLSSSFAHTFHIHTAPDFC